MVLPQALEYNWEFNKTLEQIGESARQRALMQRKLDMEEQEKVGRTLNMISPDVLNKNFSKDVVNQYLPQILNKVKELSKAGVSERQARQEVFTVLSDISEWSNKSQTIDDQIEEQVKGLDNTIYDVGRISALAKDMAKYNTVDGQKILKGKDEMDPSQSYVSMVIEKMPDLAVDERKASNAFQTSLRAIPEVEKVTEEVKDASGRRVGEKVVEKLSFLYDRDPNNNIVLKKDDKGFVPEETFQTFYSQYKPWIDGNAKRIMSRLDVPESPEATEWFKRSFLTDTLERSASGTANVSRINVTQPRSGGGGGTKPAEKKNDTNDYITRVMDVVSNGTSQDLADMLYEMRAGNGKYEVLDAKVSNKNKGFVIEFNTGEFDEDGNPIKSKQSFNPSSKTFAIDLARFYQQATGSDSKLEKSILTGKKTYNKTSKYVVGGKEYTMDELKGMGYTEDQVNQAIKAGTVKLK